MSTPNKSLSYINKDFTSIYNELLDTTSELTNKWSPRESNESDPGVVILKELALISDKNNYNIDKNILEAFPQTVTQEYNARNLYKQLGYVMPWYRSAQGTCALKWVKEEIPQGMSATIPAFTMISDENTDHVYTITRDVVFTFETEEQSVPIIEGVYTPYLVNNNNVIPLSALDSSNRLYLSDYNVAENGVFVSTNDNVTAYWAKVENIHHQPLNTRCYEFGVDARNNICYLQFPEDIASLIGTGLVVSYVVSSGYEGNIAAKTVDRFYTEISVKYGNDTIVVDDSVLKLYNSTSCTGGSDPETIEDAYKSYQRVCGTFDTLVTTRDYENAVKNSGLVSNAVVSDRTCDSQCSYDVVTEDLINPVHTYVATTTTDVTIEGDATAEITVPQMTAFDLKVYGLSPVVSSTSEYDKSFELMRHYADSITDTSNRDYRTVLNYLQDSRCVAHDFVEYVDKEPIVFKNIYNLEVKLITSVALDNSEQDKLRVNVLNKLKANCVSSKIEFGESADYTALESAIYSADTRIQTVLLNQIDYVTFAVYWDAADKLFKEIPISDNAEKSPYCIDLRESYKDKLSAEDSQQVRKLVNEKKLDSNLYDLYFLAGDNTYYKFNKANDELYPYSDQLTPIREVIIARSILAGQTALYRIDDKFHTYVDHSFISREYIDRITSYLYIDPSASMMSYCDESEGINTVEYQYPSIENSEVTFSTGDTHILVTKPENPSSANLTYTMKEHESLRLYGPSLIDDINYSNYVKFEFVKASPTGTKLSTYDELHADADYWIQDKTHIRSDNNTTDDSETAVAYLAKKALCTIYNASGEGLNADPTNISSTDLETNIKAIIGSYIINDDQAVIQSLITFMKRGQEAIGSWDYLNAASEDSAALSFMFGFNSFEVKNSEAVTVDLSNTALECFIYDTQDAFSIISGSNYQLEEGDSITFFWRGEDTEGEESPYQYVKYVGTDDSKSPILSPSFTLHGVPRSAQLVNAPSEKGYISYNSRPDSAFQKIYNMYGDNDLSGSMQIVMKHLNEVTLPSNGHHLFITNIMDEEYCYLVLRKIPGTDDVFQCILQQDEYFISANRRRDGFEIYNPGTAIRQVLKGNQYANVSVVSYKCPKLHYASVLNDGIDSFRDKLQQNSGTIGETLIREQVMYNIVAGETISVSDGVVFNSWEPTYIENTATIAYHSSTAHPVEIPQVKLNDGTKWAAIAELHVEQAIDNPQEYKYISATYDSEIGRFTDDSNKSIQILLKYDSTESEWVPLNRLDPTMFIGLNSAGQSTPASDGTVVKIDAIPYWIQSDFPLSLVGGFNVDITYRDGMMEEKRPELYTYYIVDLATSDSSEFTLSGNTWYLKLPTTEPDGTNTNPSIRVNWGPGDHLLTIERQNGAKYNLTAHSSESDEEVVTVEPLNANSKSSYDYYIVTIPDSAPPTAVTIQPIKPDDTQTGDTQLRFVSVTPVNKNEDLQDYLDRVTTKISTMDFENKFKYRYKVNENTEINNPLVASSFFDSNHICNKYCIAKCNCSYTSLNPLKTLFLNTK